jgi:hypothetical protein
VTELYRQATTRYRYLLDIESFGEGLKQEIPHGILETNDNQPVMEYLYGMADLIANEFNARVSRVVAAFNAATEPADLGLDPNEFPLQISHQGGPKASKIWGPKKTEARGWQKVRSSSDYADLPFPQAAHLLDIERMQIQFADPYSLAVFYAYLTKQSDLPVLRAKNRFEENSESDGAALEYRDVLVNVKIDDMIVEIQLALANLAELKALMHPYYKIVRSSGPNEITSQAIFHKFHGEGSDGRFSWRRLSNYSEFTPRAPEEPHPYLLSQLSTDKFDGLVSVLPVNDEEIQPPGCACPSVGGSTRTPTRTSSKVSCQF